MVRRAAYEILRSGNELTLREVGPAAERLNPLVAELRGGLGSSLPLTHTHPQPRVHHMASIGILNADERYTLEVRGVAGGEINNLCVEAGVHLLWVQAARVGLPFTVARTR